jgi:hypothetical protein
MQAPSVDWVPSWHWHFSLSLTQEVLQIGHDQDLFQRAKYRQAVKEMVVYKNGEKSPEED